MIEDKSVLCIFCGSSGNPDKKADRFLGLSDSPYPFRVRRCRPCRVRWLSPQPPEEVLEELYTNNGYFDHKATGYSYKEQTKTSNNCMLEHIKQYKQLATGRRILDVGSATGEFVEIALDAGYDTRGIEYSRDCVAASQQKGLPIVQGTLYLPELTANSFDFIHMNHVLEHLADPLSALQRINELLTPQGLLYVEVPHQLDSILDRIFSLLKRYRPYGPFSLHHMTFFSPSAIKKALKISGFDIISITTYQPCRRSRKKLTLRSFALSTLLWCADKFFKKGDVIAIWARSRKP